MSSANVVVTGLGLITGLGIGREANWSALRAGESGLRPIQRFDPRETLAERGGEAPPLEGAPDDPRDRAHAYLVAACAEALACSGRERFAEHEDAALVLGSSLAAQASAPRFWSSLLERGPEAAATDDLRCYDVENRLADLAAGFGCAGESLLVSNACAAGASALAVAIDLVRLGRADVALVAGYDALDLHTHAGFGAIKALDPRGPRPFAADRAGMLLGDGYAALVVEREEVARAAGREVLARALGYGESSDAHHLTQPDPEGRGAALALGRALQDAGVSGEQVDAVNVHCTSTPANDAAELSAMRAVFGERADRLPLCATKPALGHTLGGAGAVEIAVSLLSLRHQTLPPSLGEDAPDPELGQLDLVREAREGPLEVVVSNSFGFGGCNASAVLGAPTRAAESAEPASAVTWITGLGVACPAGVGHEALWSYLLAPEPERLLTTPPRVREGLSVPAASVFPQDFPAEDHVDRRLVRKASDLSRLVLGAAALAHGDAGELPAGVRDETAVAIGTALGSTDYYLRFYETLLRRGQRGANAVLFTEGVWNAPSGHVTKLLGLRGFGHTLVGGEEAGLSAALLARDRLALGRVRAALVGGGEACSDLALASLHREGRVGEGLPGADARRPGHATSAFAEGAACALLERADDAEARGARPYAEWLGGLRTRRWRDAVARLCAQCGVEPSAVDLVVSDAAGGERAEREAGLDLPAHALRCYPLAGIGEGFAFGSALALVTCALCLHHGQLPPTHGQVSAAVPLEARHALVVSTTARGGAVLALLRAV